MTLIAPNHIEGQTGRLLTQESAEDQGADSGKYLVKAGQVIYSKIRPQLNKATVAPSDCLCSADMYALSFRDGVDTRYAVYYILARPFHTFASVLSARVKMPKVNREELGDAPWLVPPLDEQRAIVDYLDRETCQIDTLIAEQKRLVEMLKERRQAMIDHAFAESSQRIQLRRFIEFLTSGSRGWGDYYADTGDVFVRIANLPRGSLSLGGDVQRVSLPSTVYEGQRTKLKVGDLLFSITAYVGSVAVVDQEWVDSYVSQHVALCRIDRSALDSKFTGYFMLSTEGQDQLSQGAFGGTKVQLALDDIQALRVPAPPLDKQRQIAEHLDRETSRIDILIAESERLVELSQERRTALITAAVTGQIDVRQEG
ncbi:restriction endonuclease subunit S [Streptomyces sp. NPDC005803]|uniref:restriction endonuclease subunit S n=1 Tax=Streptomyces sp. NPDC005803 TaxID=3154297 RepID=UPI0033C4AF73